MPEIVAFKSNKKTAVTTSHPSQKSGKDRRNILTLTYYLPEPLRYMNFKTIFRNIKGCRIRFPLIIHEKQAKQRNPNSKRFFEKDKLLSN